MQLEMTLSVNAILVFLLFRLASTFSLASRDLVLENLSNSTNLYRPSSQSSSNGTAVKLGDDKGTLTCLSGIHSPPLSLRSCQNAWEKISPFGKEGEEVYFRHRHEKPPASQVTLPIRWLSDDGECAIDLTLAPGRKNFDYTSGDQIAGFAKYVLEECVESTERGGYLVDFSPVNQLRIEFTSYKWRLKSLSCDPAPAVPMSAEYKESCENALLWLPTNSKREIFNTSRFAPKTVTYVLPRREPNGHGPLLVDMRTTGDVTRASWWDIWTAGVAVNTLCIQNGLAGTSTDLGDDKLITIYLGIE